jgi:acyl-CoA thioesterase I
MLVGVGSAAWIAMTAPPSRVSAFGNRFACMVLLIASFGCSGGEKAQGASNGSDAKNNMSAEKGSVNSATASSTLAAARADTPVVLFFGTSLTAGYGLDPEQAFPALIEKKSAADGLPIKAINAGLSGETTAGAVRRIDWVLRSPADLVVVESGANDALRGLSPDAARANLMRVIDAIRKKQPRAKIVLVQMEAPPNFGSAYTSAFRSVYTDISSKEKIPLVPFLLSGVAGISRYNQADGVHPNLAGERIVADNVWKALKPIVAQLDRAEKSG